MSAAMEEASVKHLEAVIQRLGTLRLRDTRNLFAILRQCDPQEDTLDDLALANGFLPAFGVCVQEVGFAYIVNQPQRTSSSRKPK